MKKWYEQHYVDNIGWVIDNLENLNLPSDEAIVVLIICFLNKNNIDINYDILGKKTGFDEKHLDQVISILCAKNYLDILTSNQKTYFSLNGLFDTQVAKTEAVLSTPIFDLFESEFGRSLSEKEMSSLVDLLDKYDDKLIIYALKEASLYKSLSFPYISKVLSDWKSKNYTHANIEKGDHLGRK